MNTEAIAKKEPFVPGFGAKITGATSQDEWIVFESNEALSRFVDTDDCHGQEYSLWYFENEYSEPKPVEYGESYYNTDIENGFHVATTALLVDGVEKGWIDHTDH